MHWIVGYLASVVAVNLAFSWAPHLDAVWSLWVGFVFILRDMVQARVGHWSLLPMALACLVSWLLGDPVVAAASAAAFAVSETVDWAVFTLTRRPLRDRLWISSACAVPADTAVFFLALGVYDPWAWAAAVLSKSVAAAAVYGAMSARQAAA
jgi:uncharacterized PurR-regulated membrane protein YhhQ (DUF165 family)